MPLYLSTSNRMEELAAALAGSLREPLPPFVPELIVVQSRGMERWLAMELARRFGVWADCDYPFPNELINRLFAAVLPEGVDLAPFAPQVMTWKLMELIPPLLSREECAPLRRYLAGDREELKLYQLAEKVADTFDHYTVFRPDLLREWERGKGDDWQALLWRELARGPGEHRGRLKEEFCRRLEEGNGDNLPERLALFGIPYLPPFHLDILAAVARHRPVHLFLLGPTREYWGDIVSPRELFRRPPGERLPLGEGNPLLASLGKVGRQFLDALLEAGEGMAREEDLFREPEVDSLLAALQSDILNLRNAAESRSAAFPPDRSLQVHSCHGPLREIEVLHDRLLDLLEAVPGLKPRDIVVMTPAIETYAPYITAVFDGCGDQTRRIPYAIADRRLTEAGGIAPLFLKLLALPGSRLTVPQVLDILESPPVSRRFSLSAGDIATLRGWLADTGVRWGMDEEHRERLGLPPYREHSWCAGLDRLFAGYALPEEGDLYNGILPFDEVEGSSARILGPLASFVAAVSRLSSRLSISRTLSGWRDFLCGVLDEFVAEGDDLGTERAAITAALDLLGELETRSGFSRPAELPVVRAWLTARLGEEDKGQGFLTGTVTFCAMLPMRSIPFRVVALVGMNDGAFPRPNPSTGFNLITRHPRRGDRSLRDEDRYLFLESILSARDALLVTYVGQSVKDNGEIPPAVVVSELLQYGGGDKLVTKHRLQAFSRDYFTPGAPLFSYSRENHAALAARGEGGALSFASLPVPPTREEREIALADLLAFFANPARWFLRNRLKMAVEEAAPPPADREPFDLDGLEAYLLRKELLDRHLRGEAMHDFLPVARGRGLLPPARHGELVFAEAVAALTPFCALVEAELRQGHPLPPVEGEVDVGDCRLTGRLEALRSHRLVRFRPARMKGKDRVRGWIEHLFLNALDPAGHPRESLLLMTDGGRRYLPVADPAPLLQSLVDLFRRGQTLPLPFFPEAASAYAAKGEWRLDRARRAWEGNEHYRGEREDLSCRRCFGDSDPLTDSFEETARTVFEPLLAHEEEAR